MNTPTTHIDESPPYGFSKADAAHFFGPSGLYFKRIAFDNGYAVSIISTAHSYGGREGQFEVAVMRADDNTIVYDTPITNDVLGRLDFVEVAQVIEKVRALPKRCWSCNPPTGWPGCVGEIEACP